MRVQRHKTIKYGTKQHHQDYLTIPSELSKSLGLQPAQIMKCTLNGDHDSFTCSKATDKPTKHKITYQQWWEKLKPFIPATGKGKPYEQIRKEAGLRILSAPAIWVKSGEAEFGLLRTKDRKTHKILWSLASEETQSYTTMPKLRDMRLTDQFTSNKPASSASSPSR